MRYFTCFIPLFCAAKILQPVSASPCWQTEAVLAVFVMLYVGKRAKRTAICRPCVVAGRVLIVFLSMKAFCPFPTAFYRSCRFKFPSLRRKYSGEDFRKHFKKSVSIVASISYDTFVLYLHVFSEYVRRVPKRPKYSPTVTIWLQKDEPNKNCNQEYVQRLFRVLICCCYSNDYVELCSGIYGSSFHPFRR